ncbi:DUF3558 domain-containing protein [Streptoalloteichus hindustanus]|uniref:DUF3558 domain-containing protein n=1 Tax=Streptoalloteichus hindustanus TaxID=2017 RepID=A0A1M4VUL8_STRHI|nr:DUF3558 domain-containing protein [Streptoalloteichus hindustanus]SHE72781.1 Protein of unknown function [Streptoalloteichus hindustanus]
MRQRTRISVAVAGVALLAALTGCGGGQEGQARPADGTTSATSAPGTSTPSGERLAPPVGDPRDASGVAPCDLLKPDAATRLGFTPPGQPLSDPSFKPCRWRGPNGAGVSVFADTGRQGLSEVYKQKSRFRDFRPVTLAGGHPAVFANDVESDVECAVYAGVADTQAVVVSNLRPTSDRANPCEKARLVAEAVIAGLPAGK